MNISKLKTSISITDYLSSIGLEPVRTYPGRYWYHSPLHNDRNPSFLVSIAENLWNDVATGAGGDIIDLVKLHHHTDTTGAISILSGITRPDPVFSLYRQNSIEEKHRQITINHIQPIRNQLLIQYLHKRKIPLPIARKYLNEAYYTNGHGKQFFALAFKNDKGGQALRNEIWKGAASPAYYTTIPGQWHDQLNIFEGVFDFLTALVYFKTGTDTPKIDCIVLNSTSHFRNFAPLLQNYSRLNLFLDNDDPGETLTRKIREIHPSVIDYSKKIFPNYNDFNDFIRGA